MWRRGGLAVGIVMVGACTKPAAEVANGAAATTAAASATATATATAPASASASAYASATATASASAPASATASVSAPPEVKIVTIGMHVGGGPYDEVTKEPMKKSVEPHFGELARCWEHAGKGRAGAKGETDVGVDLVIEAAGGRAKVSNPRTNLEGAEFKACVVAFFEQIEFLKPKNGKTVVSYSVRFTPRAGQR